MNRAERRRNGQRGRRFGHGTPAPLGPRGQPAARAPGGCPDCNAVQLVDTAHAPVYRITVEHDPTCPTYRVMEETR